MIKFFRWLVIAGNLYIAFIQFNAKLMILSSQTETFSGPLVASVEFPVMEDENHT